MRYCVACGKGMADDASFCPSCGSANPIPPTATPPQSPSAAPSDEGLVRAFIGPNAEVYLRKFSAFTVGGIPSFSITWHWPAFFFAFWWMLYRKLYLWALAALVVSCIPWVNFIAWFGWAMAANYLYFRHMQVKVGEIRVANPGRDVTPMLSAVGGVNRWVVTVAIIVSILALIAIVVATVLGVLFSGLFHDASMRTL